MAFLNKSTGTVLTAVLSILVVMIGITLAYFWWFAKPISIPAQTGNVPYFPATGKVIFDPDKLVLPLVAPQEVAPVLEYAQTHPKASIDIKPYYAQTSDVSKNTELANLANQRAQLVQGLLLEGKLAPEKVHLQQARATDNILTTDPEARRVELVLYEVDESKKVGAP